MSHGGRHGGAERLPMLARPAIAGAFTLMALAGCDHQLAETCIERGGSWVVVGWGEHMRYGKPNGTYPVHECRMPGAP